MPNFAGNERKYTSEKKVPLNRTPVENVLLSNDGRASIILGGDRIDSIDSGYGGVGFEDSSAIDIVCGRGKTLSTQQEKSAIAINPDFFSDAARIYISEKTDVDKNFKLVKGTIGDSVSASAIALKADAIRLIGVEGVKIVTRANPNNSNGVESGVKGIELIAGNDDQYLQPMVKGKNLADCLYDMTEVMSNIKSQIHSVMSFLDSFVSNYADHIHPGAPTSPTAQAMKILFSLEDIQHSIEDNSFSDDIVNISSKYLINPSLDKNILSPYNKTN
jgi:hypothetical protein